MALRESGAIDLYWNFTLVNTPKNDFFSDIEVTYDKIYLIYTNGNKVEIRTYWDSRIGLDVAKDVDFPEAEWHKIFYNNI